MEVIREGKWICPNCNQKNRGSVMKCDGCGQARENVKFIYEENGAEITDAAEKVRALQADWVCGFCNTSNPGGEDQCKQCGAGATDGQKRERRELSAEEAGIAGRGPQKAGPDARGGGAGGGHGAVGGGHPGGAGGRPPVTGPAATVIKLVVGGAVLGFMILVVLAMMSSNIVMTAEAGSWNRAVVIEEYKTVSHGDWHDKVPSAARPIGRSEKVRSHREVEDGFEDVDEEYEEKVQVGTEKVKVGVEDLGNGRFKEKYEERPKYRTEKKTRRVRRKKYKKVPVMDTWVEYELDEWVQVDEAKLQGTDGTPKWPDTGLERSPAATIGSRREGKRTESYKVTFKSPDGKRYDVDDLNNKPLTSDLYEAWMKPGSKWELEVNGLGAVIAVRAPQTAPAKNP